MASRIPKLAGLAIITVAIGGLLLAERAAPLRRRTQAPWPRLARNAAMGAACQAVVMAVEVPLTQRVARANAAQRRGSQHAIGGGWIGRAAGFLAMDYGIYLWHVATHKLPVLWRFHRVHHVDRDCDTSTALRFHFLDMLVSLPWRLVQVRLAGVDPATLQAWRGFFFLSVLFHHANWRLPRGVDRMLGRVLTTPAMHGIHHSDVPCEMDSNWSSGLSIWDRLHGTFRDDVAQQAIVIGVDDPAAIRDISLVAALAAPFRRAGRRDDFGQAT
jgi:sterol desaturase/sphingolipid hydroxylase (fatty acid hydroxylase superfamily)